MDLYSVSWDCSGARSACGRHAGLPALVARNLDAAAIATHFAFLRLREIYVDFSCNIYAFRRFGVLGDCDESSSIA